MNNYYISLGEIEGGDRIKAKALLMFLQFLQYFFHLRFVFVFHTISWVENVQSQLLPQRRREVVDFALSLDRLPVSGER